MIKFAHISDRSMLGKIIRLPLALIPPSMKLPILQGRLRGYWWIVGSGIHGYWLGSHEAEKQKCFSEILQSGQVVFDIGAQAGFYSLLASILVGPEGRVIAFEPLPENTHSLKRHLEINMIQNVRVWEAAVGSTTGRAKFEIGRDNSKGCVSLSGEVEVPLVALDDIWKKGLVPAPDIIKMDIEGGELEALRGAVNLLSRFHPLIFLSTHSTIVHHDCLELLNSIGYQVHPLLPSGKSPDEVVASFYREIQAVESR